jgi:hypothetical protein
MAASEADQHALDGYLKSLIEFAVNGGVLKGMSPEAQRAADAATASAPPSEHEFAEAGTTGDGLASEAEEEQQEE